MLYISREYVQDSLDKSVAPAAVCDSGETVVFQTRDCYDDSVTCGERPLGDRRDALGNPATGPLYIHDTRPGDILKSFAAGESCAPLFLMELLQAGFRIRRQ